MALVWGLGVDEIIPNPDTEERGRGRRRGRGRGKEWGRWGEMEGGRAEVTDALISW